MADVLITSAAEQDFTESLCWYAERSQPAATGFETEFDRALASIRADPHRFPHCDDRHRFYLMRRYPFRVIYFEQADRVVIVAVAHAKRKPDYWSNR
ncbi:MAG: type II toxin-antitoxin system RelE/ParE family toxin [Planctomycetes bacterium]|nr:type II toxin-antitoxin system RelE/ParE family toxin [Planctomycetota bacterium]